MRVVGLHLHVSSRRCSGKLGIVVECSLLWMSTPLVFSQLEWAKGFGEVKRKRLVWFFKGNSWFFLFCSPFAEGSSAMGVGGGSKEQE